MSCSQKLARSSDPETSKKAAKEIARKLKDDLKEAYLALKEIKQGTAREIANTVLTRNGWEGEGTHENYRRRCSDLKMLGLFRVSGKRPCSVTGKTCQVFELVV